MTGLGRLCLVHATAIGIAGEARFEFVGMAQTTGKCEFRTVDLDSGGIGLCETALLFVA